ncbi:hypothetical protein GOODEAATRI_023117 [Goodea atripinnis]|uniref:Uncharacterized protein n=1 Tax=Goodea atripinnis TaxID=208336 RepID=A0ABV0NCZ2_9TELE
MTDQNKPESCSRSCLSGISKLSLVLVLGRSVFLSGQEARSRFCSQSLGLNLRDLSPDWWDYSNRINAGAAAETAGAEEGGRTHGGQQVLGREPPQPLGWTMFAGRASAAGAAGPSAVVAGGKAGKFSVEELYGFTKKPKVNRGTSGKQEKSSGRKEVKEKEESELASQILEAARRLMERRRLEIYLKECDVTMEQSSMAYRYTTGEGLS